MGHSVCVCVGTQRLSQCSVIVSVRNLLLSACLTGGSLQPSLSTRVNDGCVVCVEHAACRRRPKDRHRQTVLIEYHTLLLFQLFIIPSCTMYSTLSNECFILLLAEPFHCVVSIWTWYSCITWSCVAQIIRNIHN